MKPGMSRRSISLQRAAFWIAFAACLIPPIQAADSGLPAREITSQAMRLPNQAVPGFHRGYVYFIERARITLYSPDGQLAFIKDLQEVKQRPVSVMDIAVDRNGAVAAAWAQFPSAEGRFAGIDLMDSAGKPVGFIETGAYLPSHLVFDEEHSLWTFGWQRDDREPQNAAAEYMTVRKYSSDGRLAGIVSATNSVSSWASAGLRELAGETNPGGTGSNRSTGVLRNDFRQARVGRAGSERKPDRPVENRVFADSDVDSGRACVRSK